MDELVECCANCKYCKLTRELKDNIWHVFYVCVIFAEGKDGFCVKLSNIEKDACEDFEEE